MRTPSTVPRASLVAVGFQRCPRALHRGTDRADRVLTTNARTRPERRRDDAILTMCFTPHRRCYDRGLSPRVNPP